MAMLGLDHVQVAIPPGAEDRARGFYAGILGLEEIPRPTTLTAKGGVWFQVGPQTFHCGVEDPVAPSRRHPALLTDDLEGVRRRLEAAGAPIHTDGGEIAGYRRFHTEDPFGNRLELMEREAG